jgi:leader peptidase (prepilin peptidase)/N-methyltransferase
MIWMVLAIGLAVGSFLNVLIYRLPRRLSIVWPASRCTACGRALSWFENIPLVSYAVLRGRCRTCRSPISIVYPLVELATAALFAGFYLQLGLTPLLAVRLLFACAMVALFVIDLRHRILPNPITVGGMVIGLASSTVLPPGWRDALIGAFAGGGGLLAIAWTYSRVRGQEGLGMGDVKMLAMIGAFLGWRLTLVTLVLASLAGAFAGLALIALNRANMRYALPFGTFLAAAAIVSASTGDALIAWYLGFFPVIPNP